jgi:Alginate export
MRHPLPLCALAATLALGTQVQAQEAMTTAPGVDSLKIAGTFRLRAEGRNFENSGSRRDYTTRVRLNFDMQVDDFVGAFIELQYNTNAGAQTNQDLHQAYATLSDLFNVVDMQVGRFEMSYGNQRMISPLDWSNTGRAWDGARFQHNAPNYKLDFFVTKIVEGQGAPATGAAPNRNFNGFYYERKIGDVDTDVYAFNRQDGTRDDFTVGFLVEGEVSDFSWSGEFASQFGDAAVGVDAGGLAVALAADTKVVGDFKVGLGFEYASGDDGSDPTKNDSFVPLFDFGHKYHGQMDLLDWTNLMDLILRTGAPIDDNWRWYGDLHLFTQAEKDGAGEDFLGTELDLGIEGFIGQNVKFLGGISQFVAGDTALINGALNEDQTWIFAQIGLRF